MTSALAACGRRGAGASTFFCFIWVADLLRGASEQRWRAIVLLVAVSMAMFVRPLRASSGVPDAGARDHAADSGVDSTATLVDVDAAAVDARETTATEAPGASAHVLPRHESTPGIGVDASARPTGSPATQLVSVVQASRVPSAMAREDSAAASSVVKPADSPRVGEDVAALLTSVPGVNITRRGGLGSFSTLSLRGANPNEVRIYVDGVPMNQAAGGDVDLSTIPIGDIERVEIYRGSTPLAFGESALGGVVSITTRAPERSELNARAGTGSFGTRFGDLSGAAVLRPLRIYAGIHGITAAGDYPVDATSGARRDNNDLNQYDGTLRATLALPGRRELRAGFFGFRRDQGVATFVPSLEPIVGNAARARSERGVIHVGYGSRDDLGDNSRLRVWAFASHAGDRFSDPTARISNTVVSTRDVTRSIGATAHAEKTVGPYVRFGLLVGARGETFRPENLLSSAMPVGYPASRRVATAGLEVDGWVAPWNLHVVPSARLESVRDIRTGRDAFSGDNRAPSAPRTEAWLVPRVALLRPIGSEVSLRANLGRYARPPSFVELYGYSRGFIGNPDLRSERGVNADIGVTFTRASKVGGADACWFASATMFAARANDLIAWETKSYTTRAQNISSARVRGIESELRASVGRFDVTTQATLTDARDEGPVLSRHDRQLEGHPRYRGYVRGGFRQPFQNNAWNVAAYADVDATAGNFQSTSAYGALPARVLVGAGATVEIPRWNVRASLSGYDLADSRVFDFTGYPLPGRTILFALTYSPLRESVASSSPDSRNFAKNP